ncbi:MAG: V-type ATPase subunit [Clostridiales bacterium]|nr:V-type ATPase subunit [Clostridiales bacterium]
MLTKLIQYSAVAAKVRAMYGNRLREEDFAYLAACKSVSAATAFLKAHPAWSLILDEAAPADIHRGQLERMLRNSLLEEYRRMFQFLASEDHPLMKYPLLRFETEQILSFLRLMRSGAPQDYRYSPPSFLRQKSKIDFPAFSRCTDYSSFVEILCHTDFYPVLAPLASPSEPLPAYPLVDHILEAYFFSTMLSAIDQYYHGTVRKTLESSVAMQIDILNIIHAVRLRRFLSGRRVDISGFLIPFYFHITQEWIEKIYSAPDEETVALLLRSSKYRKVFASYTEETIEENYYRALYEFNVRHIRTGVPTVYTPMAYLHLKEIELKDLITVIECIRYGVSQENMPARITGASLQRTVYTI